MQSIHSAPFSPSSVSLPQIFAARESINLSKRPTASTNPSLLERVNSPVAKESLESIRTAFNTFLTEGLCKYFQKESTAITGINAIRAFLPPYIPLYDETGFTLKDQ